MAMLAQTGEQFWPRLLGEAGTLDLSAIFAPVLVPPQDGFLRFAHLRGVASLTVRLNTRASHGRRRRSSSLPVCE